MAPCNIRLQIKAANLQDSVRMVGDREAQSSKSQRKGGWITFPFIIGSLSCFTLASGGWLMNLIVYLIKEFNVERIDAALITNVVNGCVSIFPVVGAVIADSFLGSFSVIVISSCISLMGIIALTLTATVHSLRPQSCYNISNGGNCESPSKLEYTVLYVGIILASLGLGGSRFTTASLGANQYDNPKDQNLFFDWFVFTLYVSSLISSTAIVYIQDNVSWGWGYGICIAANFIGLVIFLLGNYFYRHDKPQGSPFMALARVPVAAFRKRLALAKPSLNGDNLYYGNDEEEVPKLVDLMPTNSFRCLNRAALKADGDISSDGSIAKPWRICKVKEVEDFKSIIRILPVWLSAIFVGTPIAIQSSLTTLQALTMDRHLGPNFQIPPASFLVIIFISTSIFLPIIDRFLYPIYQKLVGKSPTPLQRIGLGHVFNVLSMAVSAIVESKRLVIAHSNSDSDSVAVVPMLSLWLFPQLVLVGIGEAFHFPGQISLYYQEFPVALRSTATAMISVVIAIAYYLSTALIDLVRTATEWLPDDINAGRLDNVYWIIAVIGTINFAYYLVCAKFYNYQYQNQNQNQSQNQNQNVEEDHGVDVKD